MSQPTQLFLVHCGYYDLDLLDGVFEQHVNFMVAAPSFEEARAKVKERPEFRAKKMHVDGLQLVEAVDGHRVFLEADAALEGTTRVISSRHRDLAPKKT